MHIGCFTEQEENKMVYLGCHLSWAKGFFQMGKTALAIGADTFQFFTRNPRGSKSKALDTEDCQRLRQLMDEHGFGPVSYTHLDVYKRQIR